MRLFGSRRWLADPAEPPSLSGRQWLFFGLIGAVLVVSAFLQIISFRDFSNNFAAMGLGAPSIWAAAVILAEIWAAAGFFKIRLSRLFRSCSYILAILTSGFWFFESLNQVSQGGSSQFTVNGAISKVGSNFFGKFLYQAPGWWTVVEASLLVMLVIYGLDIIYEGQRPVVVTKVTRKKR